VVPSRRKSSAREDNEVERSGVVRFLWLSRELTI